MKFVVLAALLSVSGVLGLDDDSSSSSTDSNKTSFLRGRENDQHRVLEPSSVFCGCSGCDAAAFDVFAGQYKCGDRISYLQAALGFSEDRACRRVAGEEFPSECGVCDPTTCAPLPTISPRSVPLVGRCGCPSCDDDAWNAMAENYSCGSRISWLQSALSYSEADACKQVASDEFPEECGRCDPSRYNDATNNPTAQPTNPPTISPTMNPTVAPTPSPTASPTVSPTESPTDLPVNEIDVDSPCGCSTCTSGILDTFAGEYKCGDRISYLQNSLQYDVRAACSQIAGSEFPAECGACDPDRCDQPGFNNNNDDEDEDDNDNDNNSSQKCGGAVNSSSDSLAVCWQDLWEPVGDPTMYCFAYGGSGDPCHLNNNNDPNDGRFKDPSACLNSDTFYLWDEPDTQARSYNWAGRTWLEYSQRFPQQLRDMRARGIKVTSPMLKAGGPGVLVGNLEDFFDACGSACRDPNDPAYIDVIAINAFCGDFNGSAGCRGGARFIYNESIKCSNAFDNIPVYITNWSRLQTSNPQDQVDAIDAIDEFFPTSAASNPIVERVYWFGATDFGDRKSVV